MLRANLKFRGIKEVGQAMRELRRTYPQAAGYGMYVVGANIIDSAKARSPVATGALRNSGYASAPKTMRNGESQVLIGFGGRASDYAIPQHENEWYQHKHGEAKYLLNAINEFLTSGARLIGRTITRFGKVGRGPVPILNVPTTPWGK